MKKILIYVLFIFANTIIFAQQPYSCNSQPESWMLDLSRYSNRYQTIPDDGRKFILNVKFHYAIGTNSENPYNLSEEKMLHYLATFNLKFNPYGIYFKYRGTDFIKDSNFVQVGQNGLTATMFKDKFLTLGTFTPESINIFVVRGNGNNGSNGIIFFDTVSTLEGMDNYYLPHEMGHILGLQHVEGLATFNETITNNLPACIFNNPYPVYQNMLKPTFSSNIPYENVTRTPGVNYNADIAGDLVFDTDAFFSGAYQNFCRVNPVQPSIISNFNEDPRVVDNTSNENIKCFYCFATSSKYTYTLGDNFYTILQNGISTFMPLGVNTWQNIVNTTLANCTSVGSGETYKVSDIFKNNFMGAAYFPGTFTPGQGIRIRESLLGNITSGYGLLQGKLNLLDDGTPDISVLYEPFSNTNSSGTTSTGSSLAYSKTYTPNSTNTGANVWNCGPFTMRFQTGFDCEFYNTLGQVIIQTPYQQFNAICNGSIGVKIPSLGTGVYYNMEPQCFGTFEPYTSGQVKSLDNLGATYYTQEELDEIKASDPDLYNDLQSGKYHVIIKRTDSGFIDQKILYKN